MGTRGEVIIPLDQQGNVKCYYINWAHPNDILDVLQTMTEKSFVKLAGDGAIRTLGGKSLLPDGPGRVTSEQREVGRNRKVAHYLTNKGEAEKMTPEKLNLVKVAADEASPVDSLDNSVYYIHDGRKWKYIWDHDITKALLDEGGSDHSKVAATLLRVIHNRFGTAPMNVPMAESGTVPAAAMKTEQDAIDFAKAYARERGWNNIKAGRHARACADAFNWGKKDPGGAVPFSFDINERHCFAQGQKAA